MLALLRRDPVLRALPTWGLIAGLNTSVVMGLVLALAARRQAAWVPSAALLAGWCGVAAFLALAASRSRVTPFELTLPIAARRLWILRLLTMATGGVAVACVGMALATASDSIARAGLDPARLAATLVAGTLLAVASLHARAPALAELTRKRSEILYAAGVLAGVPALLLALAPLGLAGAAIPAAVAVVLVVRTYRAIPAAYLLAPTEPAAAPRPARPLEGALPATGGAVGPLLRSLTAGAKELAFYPFIVLMGLLVGGAFSEWGSGDLRDLRYTYLPMASYLMFVIVGPRLATLHALDPLPVSRRLLFGLLLVPSAAVFLLACVAGQVAGPALGPRVEYVDVTRDEGADGWRVKVPLRVFEIAWDGRVPEVEAPWGESHPADHIPLSSRLRAVAWNPFSAPPGSSSRFVAWQVSRAVREVYEVEISPAAIEDRRIAGAPSLRLRADRPDLRPRSGALAPLLLTLVGVPWLLGVALLLRTYRAGARTWERHAVFWGVVVLFVLTMLAQAVLLVGKIAPIYLARLLVEIPAWEIAKSPWSVAAAWGAAAALLAGAAWLSLRQFEKAELPARPTVYSLLQNRC